jgi:hypothetical protein
MFASKRKRPDWPGSNSEVKERQKNMITPKILRERMSEQPFKPFVIVMSDGRQYPVPNHDAALIGRTDVMVGVNLDAQSIAETYARCAILHITSIVDGLPPKPRRRKARKA